MASYTSNLSLKKPAGSENVAVGDINNNMDIIDNAYGTLNNKFPISIASSSPVTYGTNVEAVAQSDEVRAIKYSNGLCRVLGVFHVTAETATGATILTLPTGYLYDFAKNGSRQAWIKIEDGKYALLSYNNISLWGTKLSAGYYTIDYWYCS